MHRFVGLVRSGMATRRSREHDFHLRSYSLCDLATGLPNHRTIIGEEKYESLVGNSTLFNRRQNLAHSLVQRAQHLGQRLAIIFTFYQVFPASRPAYRGIQRPLPG